VFPEVPQIYPGLSGWQGDLMDMGYIPQGRFDATGVLVHNRLLWPWPQVIQKQMHELDIPTDFRNTRWGMRKAQVILAEGTIPTSEEPQELYYRHTLEEDELSTRYKNAGFPVVHEIRYSFGNGTLDQKERTFFPPNMRDPKFPYDSFFGYLEKELERQYGKADHDELWLDHPISGKKWLLVYAGELRRRSTWWTPTTKVELVQERAESHGTPFIKTSITYSHHSEKRLTLGQAFFRLIMLPEIGEAKKRLGEAATNVTLAYVDMTESEDHPVAATPYYHFKVYERTAPLGYYRVSAWSGKVITGW
jgi:hypothetical protein